MDKLQQIKELRKAGKTYSEIAKVVKVSKCKIAKALKVPVPVPLSIPLSQKAISTGTVPSCCKTEPQVSEKQFKALESEVEDLAYEVKELKKLSKLVDKIVSIMERHGDNF